LHSARRPRLGIARCKIAWVRGWVCRHALALKEWIKAVLLAIAFVFWAANQFWPDAPQAMLFNDIAVALFVLDVFLVIIGWPKSSPDEDFAEIHAEPEIDRPDVTSLG
jgi:hypothetical protein